MRIQIVFTPWQSKALIAKAIVKHPLIEDALNNGVIGIGRGTTNAFILRELLKNTNNNDFKLDLDNYVAGCIDGSLWASEGSTRSPEIAFHNGKPKIQSVAEVVEEADIILKGGNALDPEGNVGVLCAHPLMGTVGSFYARALARGTKIIAPISLEKQVPYNINEMIGELGGQENIDYADGLPVSLFPMVGAEVFSEIEAIELLAPSSDVYPIGAGGIFDATGSLAFEINGIEEELKEFIDIYKNIKKTRPLKVNLKNH